MKKQLSDYIYGFVGIVTILGSFYFFYKTAIFLIKNYEKININILTAIIGGTITTSGYFITRYIEKKRNIEIEIRNKKIPIYEEFIQFYFKVVFNNLSQEEIQQFFRDFNQKAIIWFPDEILKSYIEWKENLVKFSSKRNLALKDMIINQEEFMKQIRKDIGHNNNNLNEGRISSLYINDIETIIPNKK